MMCGLMLLFKKYSNKAFHIRYFFHWQQGGHMFFYRMSMCQTLIIYICNSFLHHNQAI